MFSLPSGGKISKVQVIGWMISLDELLTKDNLILTVQIQHNFCKLCLISVKSVDHLFSFLRVA